MKTINIGQKRFKVLNDHMITRFENAQFTWIFFPGMALFFYFGFGAIVISTKRFHTQQLSQLLSLSFIIALILSAGIVWGTRLLKKKVVINRKDQTVSSSWLFRLVKRCADYSDMETRKVYIQGSTHSAFNLFLAGKKIREKTLLPYHVNYIKLSEDDEHFLPDLAAYMSYRASSENPSKMSLQINQGERGRREKIRKLEMIRNKSPKEIFVLAECYYKQAWDYEKKEDWEYAGSELRKAIDQAEKIRDKRLNFYSDLVSRLAYVYFRKGETEEALKQFRTAYNDFGDPVDLHGMALCYVKAGNLLEAEKSLTFLFEEWEVGETLVFLSDLYLLDSRKEKAVKKLKSTIKEMEETDDEDLDLIKSYYDNIDNYRVDISKTIEREIARLMANYEI